jgi:2'-5' RNA ligase
MGPSLTLIPNQWLHLTTQGIGFVGEVAEGDVEAIAEAARTRLAAIPAFDIQLGPAVLDPEAVLLPAKPSGPVQEARNALRAAIGDVMKEVPEEEAGFKPHVSIAYSAADGPAASIADALTSLGGPSARARISAADLIIIHRDNLMYEWTTHTSVPLG